MCGGVPQRQVPDPVRPLPVPQALERLVEVPEGALPKLQREHVAPGAVGRLGSGGRALAARLRAVVEVVGESVAAVGGAVHGRQREAAGQGRCFWGTEGRVSIRVLTDKSVLLKVKEYIDYSLKQIY